MNASVRKDAPVLPNDTHVTTAEAAEITGRHVATINRWVARELLTPVFTAPGKKGARYYKREDVLALAASEKAEASA